MVYVYEGEFPVGLFAPYIGVTVTSMRRFFESAPFASEGVNVKLVAVVSGSVISDTTAWLSDPTFVGVTMNEYRYKSFGEFGSRAKVA